MTEDVLTAELKRGVIRRFYYLYGKEPFLVKTYADRIIDKCLPESEREDGFNLIRFTGTLNLSQIADSVETLPVFSEKKAVFISDLDPEKFDSDQLMAAFGNIPEQTAVVISVTGFIPDVKKAKTKKFLDFSEKIGGASVEFAKMSVSKTAELITKRANRSGCAISRANAVLLAEICLCNITMLGFETDKLCAYAGYSGEITREAIDKLTERQLDAGVFALAAEIAAKRSTAAFRMFDELISLGNSPVSVLSALSMTFVDFYRAKAGVQNGRRADGIAADFGYKNRSWAVGKAVGAVSRIQKEKLRGCIKALADADYKMKSSSLNDRYLAERAVAELITLC